MQVLTRQWTNTIAVLSLVFISISSVAAELPDFTQLIENFQ